MILAALLLAAAQPAPQPAVQLVRESNIEGLDPAVARGELVRLSKSASNDDLVDLVAPFVASYGKATNMLPVNIGGPGMRTVLYKFEGGRSIVVMLHAPEPAHLAGPHACRMFMDPGKGTPDPAKFAQLVHWCSSLITAGNVEASGAR